MESVVSCYRHSLDPYFPLCLALECQTRMKEKEWELLPRCENLLPRSYTHYIIWRRFRKGKSNNRLNAQPCYGTRFWLQIPRGFQPAFVSRCVFFFLFRWNVYWSDMLLWWYERKQIPSKQGKLPKGPGTGRSDQMVRSGRYLMIVKRIR